MKITIVSCILTLAFFSANNVYCQKEVDVLVCTKSKDTINGKMLVNTNLFDKSIIDELSFIYSIKLVTDNKKLKINSEDVDYLEFIDFKGRKRVFISGRFLKHFNFNDRLIEQKFKGKLSWYRDYYSSHDGQPSTHEYFLKEFPEVVSFRALYLNKKKFKKLTEDKPEIAYLLDKGEYWEDLLEFLIKYNE